jgi:Holliday junction resolvase-like predicted endonuclease
VDIVKSSRHSKIAGDFGEALILYWLSKHGFECARVDHSGIDLIARNPHTDELMGISVKTRTRSSGTEDTGVAIRNPEFDKARQACEAFGCTPYFAIVVDAGELIHTFLLSMNHLLKLFPKGKTQSNWSMHPRNVIGYHEEDPDIKSFVFRTEAVSWWQTP